jgi:hypothetical protein
LAREALAVIIRFAGEAPFRLRPLSSNVRRHTRKMSANWSFLAVGALFVAFVAVSLLGYASATNAMFMARRLHGESAGLERVAIEDPEGSLDSALSSLRFLLVAHKRLRNSEVDRLCQRFKLCLLGQLLILAAIVVVLESSPH